MTQSRPTAVRTLLAGQGGTALAVGALLLGAATGFGGHRWEWAVVPSIHRLLLPVAELWLNALQMVVLPFVLVYLLGAVLSTGGERRMVALGARAIGFFAIALAITGGLTLVVAPALTSLYTVDPSLSASLTAGIEVPTSAREAAAGTAAPDAASMISGLLPRNVFGALSRGEMLPCLLFTVLFGAAVNTLPAAGRSSIGALTEAVSGALLRLLAWTLTLTPIAVFVFALGVGASAGGAVVGMLGVYIAIQCALMVVATLLLYPVTAWAGCVPIARFARAMLPVHLVAIGTRSSIASLPAMMDAGRTVLRLPHSATAFTLPLAVSLFKLNLAITQPVMLIFLAHVFGITLPFSALATFLLAAILISFVTVGLPSGGSAFKLLPAYIALGIPIEGVVIAVAVDAIPDLFKTVLNVTADMSAATVVARHGDDADIHAGDVPASAPEPHSLAA